jgi:hypothetical protein
MTSFTLAIAVGVNARGLVSTAGVVVTGVVVVVAIFESPEERIRIITNGVPRTARTGEGAAPTKVPVI